MRLVREGEGLVELSLQEALQMAQDAGVDLVEVDESSLPPVCKLMDYGKYLYKLQKAEQKSKKSQKQTETKEVRLGFATAEHDLLVKEKQVRKFIGKEHIVRVTLQLRGREMSHKDLAIEKINQFVQRLGDVTTSEREPSKQYNKISILLSPILKKAHETQNA